MTPLERADQVREALDHYDPYPPLNAGGVAREAWKLLPPGSLILTPDEAEKVGEILRWHQGRTFTGTHDYTLTREALALLAGKGQTERVTHGRHCTCSACAREDWARITGPCGMHGKDCPNVYAPLGLTGKGQT